eukprot:9536597-Alexandrium_andersonii.AAC.1
MPSAVSSHCQPGGSCTGAGGAAGCGWGGACEASCCCCGPVDEGACGVPAPSPSGSPCACA